MTTWIETFRTEMTNGANETAEQQITKAYRKLYDHDAVRLSALRTELKGLDINATLLDMNRNGKVVLMHLDNPRDRNAEAATAIRTGRKEYHTVWFTR